MAARERVAVVAAGAEGYDRMSRTRDGPAVMPRYLDAARRH